MAHGYDSTALKFSDALWHYCSCFGLQITNTRVMHTINK